MKKLTRKQRAAFMRAAESCFLSATPHDPADDHRYFSCSALMKYGGGDLLERYDLYLSEYDKEHGLDFYGDDFFDLTEHRQLARSLMLLLVMGAESTSPARSES